MFTWWKRRTYRNEVLVSILALTGKLEGGFSDKLLSMYPGVEEAIRAHFQDGTKAEVAALYITAAVITDLIEKQLSADQRQQILDALADGGDAPLIPTLRWMHYLGDNWQRHGDVSPEDFRLFMDEILGALEGKDSGERSRQRILESLEHVLHAAPAAMD